MVSRLLGCLVGWLGFRMGSLLRLADQGSGQTHQHARAVGPVGLGPRLGEGGEELAVAAVLDEALRRKKVGGKARR